MNAHTQILPSAETLKQEAELEANYAAWLQRCEEREAFWAAGGKTAHGSDDFGHAEGWQNMTGEYDYTELPGF
jgi:hypothetical protein